MKTLQDYENFDGIDANLDIALFEYGLIWQKTEPSEYKFIYGIGCDENCNYNLFDYAHMSQKEWNELIDDENWFETDAVCKCSGITAKQLKDGFPYTVSDAIAYYGYENIFGSSYGGFEVANNQEVTA